MFHASTPRGNGKPSLAPAMRAPVAAQHGKAIASAQAIVPKKVKKLRKLDLPATVDEDVRKKCFDLFTNQINSAPSVLKETPPKFMCDYRKVGNGYRVCHDRDLVMTTPPVLVSRISSIGEYADYNINGDAREYAPADVVSSKFAVFLRMPRDEQTDENIALANGYRAVKAAIEAHDKAIFKVYTNPGKNITFNKDSDHTMVREIVTAKKAADYVWERATETLIQTCYRPRGDREKQVPNSSLKYKAKADDDGSGETTVTETIKFTKPAFVSLYGAAKDVAAKQLFEKRVISWPERFRPLEFCSSASRSSAEPKTPFNMAYSPIPIVDISGVSLVQFLARLEHDDCTRVHAVLANLSHDFSCSLSLKFSAAISVPRTWSTMISVVDIALSVPWEMFLVLADGPRVLRSVCDPSLIASITGQKIDSEDEDEEGPADGVDSDPQLSQEGAHGQGTEADVDVGGWQGEEAEQEQEDATGHEEEGEGEGEMEEEEVRPPPRQEPKGRPYTAEKPRVSTPASEKAKVPTNPSKSKRQAEDAEDVSMDGVHDHAQRKKSKSKEKTREYRED